MLLLDGKRLPYDVAFSHEGVQYPANWLRLASIEEKNAIGIVEVSNPPSYDQRFYWGPGLPKELEDITDEDGSTQTGLKSLWIANTKTSAGTLLAPTDWYVVRNSETEVEVPAEVLARRAEIRAFCDEYETAIEATTTTDELAAYITSNLYGSFEEIPEPEPTPEPTPEPGQEPEPEPEPTPEPDSSTDIDFDNTITSGGISTDSVIFE